MKNYSLPPSKRRSLFQDIIGTGSLALMQAINRGLYSPGNLNFDIWHHLREASKVGGTPGEVLLVLELLEKDAAAICTSCRFFRANAFEVN